MARHRNAVTGHKKALATLLWRFRALDDFPVLTPGHRIDRGRADWSVVVRGEQVVELQLSARSGL